MKIICGIRERTQEKESKYAFWFYFHQLPTVVAPELAQFLHLQNGTRFLCPLHRLTVRVR